MRIVLIYFLFICLISSSCEKREKNFNRIDLKYVNVITILKGNPEKTIEVDSTITKEILFDIKKIKEVQGPIKYAKTHRIIIHYKSKANDTLFTNGTIFRLKSCFYKSKENLISKYKI